MGGNSSDAIPYGLTPELRPAMLANHSLKLIAMRWATYPYWRWTGIVTTSWGRKFWKKRAEAMAAVQKRITAPDTRSTLLTNARWTGFDVTMRAVS